MTRLAFEIIFTIADREVGNIEAAHSHVLIAAPKVVLLGYIGFDFDQCGHEYLLFKCVTVVAKAIDYVIRYWVDGRPNTISVLSIPTFGTDWYHVEVIH
jgi:hypothetical protein